MSSSPKPELRLDWCSHAAAKYAVEHWHYSRSVPNQKTVKVGVWEREQFIGCVLFGDGANCNMGRPYGVADTEACELVRVALGTHAAPVTRIVRVALLFLRRACPGIRLVLSYADPEQGHHGGVYQGGGWIYLGMTQPADEYLVRGVRMHGRALRSTRSTHRLRRLPCANILDWTRRVIDPAATRIEGSAKHRYLYPLDAEMRARILPLAKPYPKRPKERAPEDHSGLGGATPTRPLHSTETPA